MFYGVSILNLHRKGFIDSQEHPWLLLLLLLSNDIERVPGPHQRVVCFGCTKTIRKNQASGICTTCHERLHIKCMKDTLINEKEHLFCHACFVYDFDGESVKYSNPMLSEFVKKSGLKVLHQNVNGLLKSLDKIKAILSGLNKNIQFLGLSETHNNGSVSDLELSIDGYTFERKDRIRGSHGGVLCYIRSDIIYVRRSDLENTDIEAIWIEILVKNSSSILICIMYRPPDSSKYLYKDFDSSFDDMISLAVSENKESILSGDLNCNYLSLNNQINLKNIISANGFKQLIKTPTRITKGTRTLIDIIATTDRSKVSDTIVFPSDISDHDLVGIVRKMHIHRLKPRKIYVRDYTKYNKKSFKNDLRNAPWETVFIDNDFNNAWNKFKFLFSNVVDKHVPITQKTVRGKDTPWLTHNIRDKMHERDHLLKTARRTGTVEDWSRYKKARNTVTYTLRQSKAKYLRNSFHEKFDKP